MRPDVEQRHKVLISIRPLPLNIYRYQNETYRTIYFRRPRAAEIEYYTTDNDHLDMNALKANRMELQAYMDCFNDKAPCSTLAASYKKNIPESIVQACRRCNPNQKYMFWAGLQAAKEVIPESYWNFRHHYDPENKYFDAFEKEISKYVKPDMEVVV